MHNEFSVLATSREASSAVAEQNHTDAEQKVLELLEEYREMRLEVPRQTAPQGAAARAEWAAMITRARGSRGETLVRVLETLLDDETGYFGRRRMDARMQGWSEGLVRKHARAKDQLAAFWRMLDMTYEW